MTPTWKKSLLVTAACVLLAAGHALWGHPATAVGFGLLTIQGVVTTLVLRAFE